MLPESNSLRTLNKWLTGSGYQIRQTTAGFRLENEDGDLLCRRKRLDALKLELEARMAADARSSELDTLPSEFRRLLKTHGLRPVINAVAKAVREAIALREHIPHGHPDFTSIYTDDLITAANNLESDLY